jgi:hypothetical protein
MRVVDSETRRAVRLRRLAALEADNYLDEVAAEGGADGDLSEDEREASSRRQGEVRRECVSAYCYYVLVLFMIMLSR